MPAESNRIGEHRTRVLVILTHAFPYAPPSERYLEDELPILREAFDRAILLPTSRTAEHSDRSASRTEGYEVVRVSRRPILVEFLAGMTDALRSRALHAECISLTSRRAWRCRKALRSLVIAIVHAHAVLRALRPILDSIPKDAQIVLYSYWMSHLAYSAGRAKTWMKANGWTEVVHVSRAHGSSDLYLSDVTKGYFPGLADLRAGIDRIYAISEAGGNRLATMGFPVERISVQRLGVQDPGAEAHRRTGKTMRIFSCSSIGSVKRLPLLVEGLASIQNLEIEWVHIGDGPDRTDVQRLAEKILPPNVRASFCGNLPNDQVRRMYDQDPPDLFLNVSRIEGIPVTLMEAISFGIPIVATDVGGVSEICIDGFDGRLLPAGFHPSELAAVVEEFAAMPDEAYRFYSENARSIFRDRFEAYNNHMSMRCDLLSLLGS